MILHDEGQALCVATEMERRAIRVYERALMMTEDAAVRAGIESILADERAHLRRFTAMRAQYPLMSGEEQLLIEALGAEVLLQGGVMELVRGQALTDVQALFAYAAESEAEAVRRYKGFAEQCENAEVREAFLSIAREESGHLLALRERCGSEVE